MSAGSCNAAVALVLLLLLLKLQSRARFMLSNLRDSQSLVLLYCGTGCQLNRTILRIKQLL